MYSHSANEILSKGILKNDEIFNFEFSPYCEQFQKIYKNLYQILQYESEKYNISNCFLLYLNDRSFNAKAGKINDTSIILINCGIIFWQIKNTTENEQLRKYNTNYNNIFSKIQLLKFEELSLQLNILFTFYHEFAHILQKSESLMFWNSEKNDNKPFSFERHSLEIDADTFSAIHIARSIIDYYEKNFKQFGIKVLEEITIILCSNLFFYISSFGQSDSDLYYFENSHPHPYIRIMRILFTIGKYYEDDIQININKNYIVGKIIDEIFDLQYSQNINNLPKFKDEFSKNYENIYDYLKKISNYEETKINSAIAIYNRFAE